MNPLALLLLAAAAGGGHTFGSQRAGTPVKLDAVLDQLHGAVSTLEKVNELTRMSNTMGTPPFSFPAPSSGHIPASAEITEESSLPPPAQNQIPSFPNLDLQNAMQTLGPILSMLGNNQNSR